MYVYYAQEKDNVFKCEFKKCFPFQAISVVDPEHMTDVDLLSANDHVHESEVNISLQV